MVWFWYNRVSMRSPDRLGCYCSVRLSANLAASTTLTRRSSYEINIDFVVVDGHFFYKSLVSANMCLNCFKQY